MENPSWLFVAAAVISVVGFIIIFRQLATNIENRLQRENTVEVGELQKDLQGLFTKFGLIEFIPLLLIVYGFMNIGNFTASLTDTALLTPLVTVIMIFILGFLVIISTTRQLFLITNLNDDIKRFIQSTRTIGLGLISALPIIAIVAIFLMSS